MSYTVAVPIHLAEQIFKQNHKVRTVEDLWNIQLEPSSVIIRPTFNEPLTKSWSADDLDWKKAWTIYSAMRATAIPYCPWWKVQFNNWFDRLRFNAHVKLIQWKVLI